MKTENILGGQACQLKNFVGWASLPVFIVAVSFAAFGLGWHNIIRSLRNYILEDREIFESIPLQSHLFAPPCFSTLSFSCSCCSLLPFPSCSSSASLPPNSSSIISSAMSSAVISFLTETISSVMSSPPSSSPSSAAAASLLSFSCGCER